MTASTMNSMEIIAVVSLPVTASPVVMTEAASLDMKVPATTFTKDAMTRIRTSRAKMRKRVLAFLPIVSPMISPTDLPP